MEGMILKVLFNQFNDSGVGYCVLRNYETLPGTLDGSDLDLAVLPESLDDMASLIFKVAKKFGGDPIMDYTSSGRMIRLLGCSDGEWWGMAIDLFPKMEYRGVEYISTRQIIERAKDHGIVKAATDEDAAVTALIKELLSNGKTRKDYFPDAVQSYSEHGDSALELMREHFNHKVIESFEQLLKQGEEDALKIRGMAKMLQKDVLGGLSLKKWIGRLKNIWFRYRRILKPIGSSVVVLGTDGSGKSTMIESITPVLEQALHSKVQYEHLRPNWLPALGVATGKRKSADAAVVTDPHAQKPSGFLGSVVRLFYYSLDYTLGYWIKVYPRLVKRPHICLFDRYYYDFLLDPRRMRIKLPLWMMRGVFLFVTEPRLVVCLGGKPEKIYARKPETSLEEVKRQILALKKLCDKNPRAVWIETGVSIEESRHQVLSAVKASLSSR